MTEPGTSVQDLLVAARAALRNAVFRPEPREASLLLAHVLGWSEVRVLAHPEAAVGDEAARRYRELLQRRLAATPVAYLLGEREFWGRSFFVDDRGLVPRPETEHLVEVVRAIELPAAPRILEAGTGSGCLAVTLALELAGSSIVATDLSPAALGLAATNLRRHRVESRIRLVAADLLAPLRAEDFDLVVSNPPYVSLAEIAELSPEVLDYEPALALFGEGDGTGTLERLMHQAYGCRYLALEIGAGQRDKVESLAAAAGWRTLRVEPDLAGIPRTLLFGS